tara:strand:- start:1945 stop:2166 length:222 start_codon:yes stop_codon:yes gene_type:complete
MGGSLQERSLCIMENAKLAGNVMMWRGYAKVERGFEARLVRTKPRLRQCVIKNVFAEVVRNWPSAAIGKLRGI